MMCIEYVSLPSPPLFAVLFISWMAHEHRQRARDLVTGSDVFTMRCSFYHPPTVNRNFGETIAE